MPTSVDQTVLSVALVGNPNTGKSTLFGALAGIHQRVGNYPGVTVEKRTGRMEYRHRRYELIDLPGLYSLAPRSRDEIVAVEVLLGCRREVQPVDAVICIADASNLRRNLYLLSQVLDLHLPTVLAVNMFDVARNQGVSLDVEQLQQRLGVPVVAMQANRRIGIDELKDALAEVVTVPPPSRATPLPEPFGREAARLQTLLARHGDEEENGAMPRALVERLLLDVNGYLQGELLADTDGEARRQLEAARARLGEAGCRVPEVETTARYDWIARVLQDVVTEPSRYKGTVTDRIDRVLTHRVWGTLIFALVMIVVFQSVFTGAQPLMQWIDNGFAGLGQWVELHVTEGVWRSLLVDGVIGGVGAVLAFLPQILILFLFIAVLEDCGYMARAAYLMDKMMVRVGLSGKSFIPMVSSFACAIPGIMATRVIEDDRDRLTTILVAPLMTCSARLPVYALLIAAFIPQKSILEVAIPGVTRLTLLTLQGLTLMGLYALGILAAVGAALVLKKTILRGQAPPFLMELPSYKWPSVRTAVHRVLQRGWVFLRCAGTMILAVTIIVWAALYYPHDAEVVEAPFRARIRQLEARLAGPIHREADRQAVLGQLAQVQNEIAGAYQRQSLLGRVGRWIEPVFIPLGWDWRIGSAVIASFPAREVVVATLGVMYNLGEDLDTQSREAQTQLHARLHSATWAGSDRPVFNVPVALSIMVFYALCAQCIATLAVIKRETNTWRWPIFAFTYMTTLAYSGALITYQVGAFFS